MFKKSAPTIPVKPEPPSKDDMMEDISDPKANYDILESAVPEVEEPEGDLEESPSEDSDVMDIRRMLGEAAELHKAGKEIATKQAEDLVDSALGAPSRRQAFKAVVNLIEAFEELQRAVPLAKRSSPPFKVYQQRIFEVMKDCLRQLMESRSLLDHVSFYERFVEEYQLFEEWNS